MCPPITLHPALLQSTSALGHRALLIFKMSPLRITLSHEKSLEIPWIGQTHGRRRGRAAGLTSDAMGTVIAHHLLCLRHHRAAEPIVTGTGLAAAGVAWVVVETEGAVRTLDVGVLIP